MAAAAARRRWLTSHGGCKFPCLPAELFQYSGVTGANFAGFISRALSGRSYPDPVSLTSPHPCSLVMRRPSSPVVVPCFAFPFEVQARARERRQCQLLTFSRRTDGAFSSRSSIHLLSAPKRRKERKKGETDLRRQRSFPKYDLPLPSTREQSRISSFALRVGRTSERRQGNCAEHACTRLIDKTPLSPIILMHPSSPYFAPPSYVC